MKAFAFSAVSLLSGLLMAGAAIAQPAGAPQVVSGTVVAKGADSVTVKADGGGEAAVKLTAETRILLSVNAKLSDFKAGDFIGCTAEEEADGKLHAREIHIFASALRGLGEGHTPMKAPKTTMTNGNVAEYTAEKKGAKLKVTYKGGEREIEAGADVPVTKLLVSDASKIVSGAKVRLFILQGADNTLTATNITVDQTK